ncbi:MAG: anaerobic ribonucleoside-triphosphate reductase [archaeon]|jgi:ribonucleoside-triphosphate reductase|nr:anaerobic ribonucleoside-triphosphate reductase [archaeon]
MSLDGLINGNGRRNGHAVQIEVPASVIKRDGRIVPFDKERIYGVVRKAAEAVADREGRHIDEKAASEVADYAIRALFEIKMEGAGEFPHSKTNQPHVEDVQDAVLRALKETGHNKTFDAFSAYRAERDKMRGRIGISVERRDSSTTDMALQLAEVETNDELTDFSPRFIARALMKEAYIPEGMAYGIAKEATKRIASYVQRRKAGADGKVRIRPSRIREFVNEAMEDMGLEERLKQQDTINLPKSDINAYIYGKSSENSNVASNNPEAFNLAIAEAVQKAWALDEVFTQEVADAHRKGEVHLHDLGYPTRVYCSSHSIEYLKKYGLNKLLANLEAKSKSPNRADVLNQHMQTFLASMQAHYAGALGFGFVNIFYAPLLFRPTDVAYGKLDGREWDVEKKDLEKLVEQGRMTRDPAVRGKPLFEQAGVRREISELPYDDYKQVAQHLIFAASQNAFSRGGQTLFIDFNVHTGVPEYLREVPAIGPKGMYMIQMPDGEVRHVKEVPRFNNPKQKDDPRNGDADDEQLRKMPGMEGAHILKYKDFTKPAQKFAKAMLEIWKEGDMDGRPFHFPKCDLHIDENTLVNPDEEEVFDYACKVAAENGSVYFMPDRGGAQLAQCCRLKEKITDMSMIKNPERLRFCGFQNVTINLPQAAYKSQGANLEERLKGTLENIDHAMEIALKAHQQKAKFIRGLLERGGTPQSNLGRPSDDGTPYLDLDKSTYIIGNIGLNEAVQSLTGEQLHESEKAYRVGLEIIAHMYKRVAEFKEQTGLKFTLEETPAESTTRRLAKLDRKHYPQAAKVIKGTEKDPYYTNSIHYSPDAPVGLVDRIVGQSRFHDMIESGAIVHAWEGERRPDPEYIKRMAVNTLRNTRCSQLVFSPTYSECDNCGKVMNGERKLCDNPDCDNHKEETLKKDTGGVYVVTRIVGYNSRLRNWNGSQMQIYEDRKKAEAQYAGEGGIEMPWLHNPNGHERLTIMQFGKSGCGTCENVEQNTRDLLGKLGLNGNVDYQVFHLDEHDEQARKGVALAALYGVPLDSVPTMVVAGRSGYWKKTTSYASQTGAARSDLIKNSEVRPVVQKYMAEYGIASATEAPKS